MLGLWSGELAFSPPASLASAAFNSENMLSTPRPDWDFRSVVAWGGDNRYGQLDAPLGLKDVVQVAAGFEHSLALESNGTVVGWGRNDDGQASVPDDLKNVVDIAAGLNHSLALKSDGSIVCWGREDKCPNAQEMERLTNIIDIAASNWGSAVLGSDGTITKWSSWDYSTFHPYQQTASTTATKISGGGEHYLALRSDGTVDAFGMDSTDALGVDRNLELSGITELSAGLTHSLAIKEDGSVVAWGYGEMPGYKPSAPNYGQSLVPAMNSIAVDVAAGEYHSVVVLATGFVTVFGDKTRGQGTLPKDLGHVVAADSNGHHTLAITVHPRQMTSDRVTITGDFYAGGTVTANPGSWTPGAIFEYQWFGSSGTIIGATNRDYKIKYSDIDGPLMVRVQGVKLGYTPELQYSPSGEGKILASNPPLIRNSRQVGSTLYANPQHWSTGATLTYQWFRDGSPINGAISNSYTLSTNDADHIISLAVTGRKAGWKTVTRKSENDALVMLASTPSVNGNFSVGQELSVDNGTWSNGVTFDYQWFRDGAQISGAVQDKYLIAPEDIGRRISVRVSANKGGYEEAVRYSNNTAYIMASGEPRISGQMAVGSTLSVSPGIWTSGVSYSYRWFRGDVPISGATKKSYRLVSSDAGSPISVRVVGTKSGWASVTRYSPKSLRVMVAPVPKILGSARSGKRLSVKAGSWTKGTTLEYKWYVGGKLQPTQTGNTLLISRSWRGKSIKVAVVGTLDGFVQVTRTSSSTSRVR